jgi:hypothetical protein
VRIDIRVDAGSVQRRPRAPATRLTGVSVRRENLPASLRPIRSLDGNLCSVYAPTVAAGRMGASAPPRIAAGRRRWLRPSFAGYLRAHQGASHVRRSLRAGPDVASPARSSERSRVDVVLSSLQDCFVDASATRGNPRFPFCTTRLTTN